MVLRTAGLAADFRITSTTKDTAGHPVLRFESETGSYYVLQRSQAVTPLGTPVLLTFGQAGSTQITDSGAPAAAGTLFYRLLRVPVTAPLDTDGDGIDDVYELQHSTGLNPLDATDAAKPSGDGRTWLERYRIETAAVTTIVQSSPTANEAGVSVTRETFFRLSAPLAADALLKTDDFYAMAGGRKILSRTELSLDRQTVTLFYLENLPGGSRVNVTLRGDNLKDVAGRAVDADGDGLPGGSLNLEFDTVSMTPIVNTAVSGQVLRSDLAPGAANLTNIVERPLQGVIIEVIGAEETIRTTTDAQGRFTLNPSPVGRFFVRIDGRPCTSYLTGNTSLPWAERAYYPVIEKAWTAVAGRTDNLAGAPLSTNGIIYLPLVASGTLQPVSATQDTMISFPKEVTDANPALLGVEIMVPANALLAENGARGGMVGIAPVASGRLPEPLPPGLKHTLDISIQTDGPQNFDRPVPVRFPNLPDPVTGVKLPPGAKSALWSFSHDLGRWQIAGPMTVTADGNFVESDPGVGVTRPGWHGSMPGTPPDGPPPTPPCGGSAGQAACVTSIALGLFDCATSFIPAVGTAECLLVNGVFGGTATARDCIISGGGGDCAASAAGNAAGIAASCFVKSIPGFGSIVSCTAAGIGIFSSCAPCIVGSGPVGPDGHRSSAKPAANPVPEPVARYQAVINFVQATIALQKVTLGTDQWTQLVDFRAGDSRQAADQIAAVLQAILAAAKKGSDGGAMITDAELNAILALPRPASLPESLIRSTVAYLRLTETLHSQGIRTHAAAGGRTDFMDIDEFRSALDGIDAAAQALVSFGITSVDLGEEGRRLRAYFQQAYMDNRPGAIDSSLVYFELVDITTGTVFRGRLQANGKLPVAALSPNDLYRITYYEPLHNLYSSSTFESANSGFTTTLATPLLLPIDPSEADSDGDGLPDVAEEVLGTARDNADSDGDGIPDGVEIRQGTNPLDGKPAATGIIASAPTPGPAQDLATVNNFAVVAEGAAGVGLYDVSGVNPLRIAQLATPGPAVRVAAAGSYAAVACQNGGLILVDFTDPATARISGNVLLNTSVESVALAGNIAYAGCANGRVVAIDIVTGSVLETLSLARGTIMDLGLAGDYLYALTPSTLAALPLDGEGLRVTGTAPVSSPIRLTVGAGLAYVTYFNGVNLFSLADPAAPVFLVQNNTAQRGWLQLAPTGSGPGLACTGVNGPDDVNLYGLGADGKGLTFQTTFPTPGIATAVSIYNGLAYVADGASGLQVINYLAYDNKKQPPTIALAASFPITDATASAEEGKLVRLTALVTDDVQVRNVEFYVDGALVATDGNFPFEHRFTTPLRSDDKTNFLVRAKATDTGGNFAWSKEVVVTLVPDATPPHVRRTQPADGDITGSTKVVSVYFNEPVTGLTGGTFRLKTAGPDGITGNADDVVVASGAIDYRDDLNAAFQTYAQDLAPGLYLGEILPPTADLAGNAIHPYTWRFWIVGGADSDHDGVPDAIEAALGLNPNNPDTNGNGVADGDEDFDGDGLPNRWEILYGYDPRKADSDDNGVRDGDEDPDFDSLSNYREFQLGTNPLKSDSDGDGWDDATEALEGSDPLRADSGARVVVASSEVSFLNGLPDVIPSTVTVSVTSFPVAYLNGLAEPPPASEVLSVVSAPVNYLNALAEPPPASLPLSVTTATVSYLNALPEPPPADWQIYSPVVSYRNQPGQSGNRVIEILGTH
jgi:hypothetical protein